MKRSQLLLMTALLFVMGSIALNRAEAQAPVLIKATFFSHTNEYQKSLDTGVYITVSTSNASSILAQAVHRDSEILYAYGSDHQFDLDLNRPRIAKADCKGFKVHISIHTHAKNTWRFNGRVVLYFSDHTSITADSGHAELSNDGASDDFSAPIT